MKGTNSEYRPDVGVVCLVKIPNEDNAEGYSYAECIIYWRNDIFVLYGHAGYGPVLNKWEHVLCRPLDANFGDLCNRRAPEPMISVFRWTRYDGSPETLPENDISFDKWSEGDPESVNVAVIFANSGFHIFDAWHRVEDEWESLDSDFTWGHNRRTIQVGDIWAPYPELPEKIG